jgi:hypothetical protein
MIHFKELPQMNSTLKYVITSFIAIYMFFAVFFNIHAYFPLSYTFLGGPERGRCSNQY